MSDETGSGLPPDVVSTVLTVGSFDGVHRGHQDLLARLVARARSLSSRSLLVTFDPHPLDVVNQTAAPPLLTVGEEKLEVLAESGVEYVAVVPFTRALADFEAERFVDEILIGRYRVAHLLMGHDHGFGRNRRGNADVMRTLGDSRGFTVEVIEPVKSSAGPDVSSTLIRRAVAGGDLSRAAEGLGRPYSVSGRVASGEQRGGRLGFPTLNVAFATGRKLLPPLGVYAVRAQTPLGPFGGMMNLGSRPTVGDLTTTLEVHLFDVTGDFYGNSVRVDVVERLRDIKRFDSLEALKAQLARDEVAARQALSEDSSRPSVDDVPRGP